MKIKNVWFWEDIGYLESTYTVPKPNNFKLPTPLWKSGTLGDFHVEKDKIFSELRLAIEYKLLQNAMYLLVLMETSGTSYYYYGWIDDINILSEDPPHTRVRWHVDLWRTYINQASFGYGLILRRPILNSTNNIINENPIQQIEYKYRKVGGFRNFPIIRGDMHDDLVWAIITYISSIEKGDKKVEQITTGFCPISIDPSVSMHLRKAQSDSKSYICLNLNELTSTSLSAILSVPHEKILGVWLSPIPLIKVLSINKQTRDIYVNLNPSVKTTTIREYLLKVQDLLNRVDYIGGGERFSKNRYALMFYFKDWDDKGVGFEVSVNVDVNNVTQVLLDRWWGGPEHQFEGNGSKGWIIHTIKKSKFIVDSLDAIKSAIDDDDFANLADFTTISIRTITNQYIKFKHAKRRYQVDRKLGDHSLAGYCFTWTFDYVTIPDIAEEFTELIKLDGEWYASIYDNEGELRGRVPIAETLITCDEPTDFFVQVHTPQRSSNFKIIEFGNYGIIESLSGIYSVFNVDIEPRLKPNEFTDIMFTDMDGHPIHQFPIGIELKKCEVRHVLNSSSAYLSYRFSGINSYSEGLEVTLPLQPLDVMSNVVNQYLTGGNKEYDLRMQQLSVQQSITSGLLNMGLSTLSSGVGGMGVNLLGLGINALSQNYFQGKAQENKDWLTANQQDAVLMRGNGKDWIYYGRPPGFSIMTKDKYSVQQYNLGIKHYGLVTHEIVENCNELLKTSGPWQIKDLYVDGKIPIQAKEYIKRRLSDGVYVEEV